tara:strand:+ start:15133 stop:15915 length:783 start_codon:yes stop_codon:yes gene_type:complete
MATTNVKILLRRGLRKEISADTLATGEMGFAYDTNQLYVGIDSAINELQFDPFTNAQAVVQSWLDSADNPEPGLTIDEDLVIRQVSDVDALITAMDTSGSFNVHEYGRARRNVEVVTENSFNQMFADQHLQSLDAATGRRSSLFNKELKTTAGTFLRYLKTDCTSFFIDYSLKQTDGNVTYVRVGQIKVINGVPQGINQVKLSDDNTEIWQDDGDNIAEPDEFSNINFDAVIDGDDIKFNYTQNAGFETDISFTVKRWTM